MNTNILNSIFLHIGWIALFILFLTKCLYNLCQKRKKSVCLSSEWYRTDLQLKFALL